jgi:hypothetical protein
MSYGGGLDILILIAGLKMALFPQKILFGDPHFVAFLFSDPSEGTSAACTPGASGLDKPTINGGAPDCFSEAGTFLDLL